ncbi:hypothetical protein D3C73_1224710 [compost metagenome]
MRDEEQRAEHEHKGAEVRPQHLRLHQPDVVSSLRGGVEEGGTQQAHHSDDETAD